MKQATAIVEPMTIGKIEYKWLAQYRKLIDQHVYYLKFAGVWVVETDSSVSLRLIYRLYNRTILIAMCTFSVTLFADICSNIDDLSIATDDGCILTGIVVVIYKVIVFQLRRNDISQLIDRTLETSEIVCQSSNRNVKDIVDHYLLRIRTVFYGFSVVGFFLSMALIFFVPTDPGCLPIGARYPFDTSHAPWYQLTFAIEASSVFAGLMAIIGMDGIQTVLYNILLLQYEILNGNFEDCGMNRDDKIGNSRTGPPGDEFASSFRKCIHHHQRLIGITEDLNRVLKTGTLVQVLSSWSMICLTGFQAVVVAGQNSKLFKFAVYLGAAVSQLLYLCWLGNELIYHSIATGSAQWMSKWNYDLPSDVLRLISMTIFFSKKPQIVKGGDFFTLSLQTFIAIMRGSYSFFALLNKVHEE